MSCTSDNKLGSTIEQKQEECSFHCYRKDSPFCILCNSSNTMVSRIPARLNGSFTIRLGNICIEFIHRMQPHPTYAVYLNYLQET